MLENKMMPSLTKSFIALINGNDGVCKRLKKYADSIALISLNPNYEPMYFSQKEISEKPV